MCQKWNVFPILLVSSLQYHWMWSTSVNGNEPNFRRRPKYHPGRIFYWIPIFRLINSRSLQNREVSNQQLDARNVLYIAYRRRSIATTIHAQANQSTEMPGGWNDCKSRTLLKTRHERKRTGVMWDKTKATKQILQHQYQAPKEVLEKTVFENNRFLPKDESQCKTLNEWFIFWKQNTNFLTECNEWRN